MRCSSSRLLFEGLLDGALTSRTQAALQKHLERCAECGGLLEELRVVDALLLHASLPEPPENFTQRTMAEIVRLPVPRPSGTPLWGLLTAYLVSTWLAIALAFVFDGAQTRAAFGTALRVAGAEWSAAGSLAHGLLRAFDSSLSGLTAFSVGALVVDVMAGIALVTAYAAIRRRSEIAR